MADDKTEHRGDMGKVAKDREKAPEAGQKGSQRTQGGHQETQPSQSSEKGKVGGWNFAEIARRGARPVIEPPHQVVTPIAARSAVKLGRMRYVLGISLAMVIVLLIVAYLIAWVTRMSLTILPQNPRLPDEPMMTLIAGQPNAAATVDQCEA
jgi:uncharacterized protein